MHELELLELHKGSVGLHDRAWLGQSLQYVFPNTCCQHRVRLQVQELKLQRCYGMSVCVGLALIMGLALSASMCLVLSLSLIHI